MLACSASFLSSWGDPAHTSRTSAAHLVASSCVRFASCLALPSALCFALLCRCLSVSGSKPACCFPVLLPPFKASHHAVTAINAFFVVFPSDVCTDSSHSRFAEKKRWDKERGRCVSGTHQIFGSFTSVLDYLDALVRGISGREDFYRHIEA